MQISYNTLKIIITKLQDKICNLLKNGLKMDTQRNKKYQV